MVVYDRAQGAFFGGLWALIIAWGVMFFHPPFDPIFGLGGCLAGGLLGAGVASWRHFGGFRPKLRQAVGGAWMGFLISGGAMLPGVTQVGKGDMTFAHFCLLTLLMAGAGSLAGFILGLRDAVFGKR